MPDHHPSILICTPEIDGMQRQLIDWLASDEGARALRSTLQRLAETCAQLQQSVLVDRELMNEPFTV